jgi:hypothetical protein
MGSFGRLYIISYMYIIHTYDPVPEQPKVTRHDSSREILDIIC